jgi:phospholipase D1/2
VDLHAAISSAQRLVYVTGWSVFTSTRLVRGDGGEEETVGELLRRKAKEGVKVLIMTWNDKSNDGVSNPCARGTVMSGPAGRHDGNP